MESKEQDVESNQIKEIDTKDNSIVLDDIIIINASDESLSVVNEQTSNLLGENKENIKINEGIAKFAKMSHSTWCNPPPPGIDMDEESKQSTMSSSKSATGSVIDIIDPYIKNPDYIKYKKSLSKERHHHRRSQSRSHDRYRSRSRDRRKRHRSRSRDHRSRSRGHRRRSRSRSRTRNHRHRHHTSSSGRSRSSSYESYRHKTKKKYSRKRSRSSSQSRRQKHERLRSRRSPSDSQSEINNSSLNENDPKDEEEEPDPTKDNAFKNDGSFLEMFKKMQEEKEKEKSAAEAASSEATKILPAFGKRRGGRVLKTGKVEKTKTSEDDELANAQDPWSVYLKEVKKYKEACCDDDSKTRPLVK